MTEKMRWRLLAKASPHLRLAENLVLQFIHLEMVGRGPEPLPVPQRGVAARIGMSPYSVELALRSLVSRGLLDRGHISFHGAKANSYSVNFDGVAALIRVPPISRHIQPPHRVTKSMAARPRDRSPA